MSFTYSKKNKMKAEAPACCAHPFAQDTGWAQTQNYPAFIYMPLQWYLQFLSLMNKCILHTPSCSVHETNLVQGNATALHDVICHWSKTVALYFSANQNIKHTLILGTPVMSAWDASGCPLTPMYRPLWDSISSCLGRRGSGVVPNPHQNSIIT